MILAPRQVATTIPPSVLNDAVRGSTVGGFGRGAFDVGRGSGVSVGLVGWAEVDPVGLDDDAVGGTDGVGVPGDVTVGEAESCGGTTTTRSAAEARPTPLPALLTTTKVMAPTAPTTANQPSTMTRSGRRPILTTFGLCLL
ncbi:MAG: hypothetical protein ACJ711_02155 [Ornithinibacter sp.]